MSNAKNGFEISMSWERFYATAYPEAKAMSKYHPAIVSRMKGDVLAYLNASGVYLKPVVDVSVRA